MERVTLPHFLLVGMFNIRPFQSTIDHVSEYMLRLRRPLLMAAQTREDAQG
jgi:hypothetical protein